MIVTAVPARFDRCATPCPRPAWSPPGTVAVPKTFEQLDVGDRVQTWDGINATVVDVLFHLVEIHDGTLRSFEATVVLHSVDLPTFDALGWPKSYEGHITRRVRRHDDLRHHNAGRPADLIGAP